MYAVLGDLQFELITYFDGFELRAGANFAEHALIERKPRLQFTGDALDEIRLTLSFHDFFCDPEAELARLMAMLRSHQPGALVFGNGAYKGYFVVTELQAVSRHTDSVGTVKGAEATITLREFTGDPAKPLQKPGAQGVAPVGAVTQMDAPALVASASANPLRDALRTVAVYGAQARAAIGGAMSVVGMVQQITQNPLAALSYAPGLIATLGRGAAALAGMSPILSDLAPTLAEAGQALAGVAPALAAVANAATVMRGANAGNILGSLDSCGYQLESAGRSLTSVSAPLARLSSRVALRDI